MVLAERRVAHQLPRRNLSPGTGDALNALLQIKEGAPMSVLAW
jgi:hypothetical protein